MSAMMDLMRQRHSVRQYLDKPIPEPVRKELDAYVDTLNLTAGLHMQILYDEPECFSSRMAKYGRFENARNYIVLAGKRPRIWRSAAVIMENCWC